jgi:pimeloyl-ACP methyl ester carboxylesterase
VQSSIARAYTTGAVISADGTSIGYRQLGHGPGVVLLHGGMQASQNFMRLASHLSDAFTVYVPDRRGRGSSGAFGDRYGIERECEDLDALLTKTGARDVFALSSGALIAMRAELTRPRVGRLALYEPPFPLGGRSFTSWVARFDEEIAKGDLASAMVTVIKATGDSWMLRTLPRFLLVPLIRLGIRAHQREVRGDDVPISALIPTMHYDPQLVKDLEGTLGDYRAMRTPVLLLGGARSQRYLRQALDALGQVIPHARRVEFPGVGHLAADDSGKPELVAGELRRFFSASDPSTMGPATVAPAG